MTCFYDNILLFTAAQAAQKKRCFMIIIVYGFTAAQAAQKEKN